MPCRSGPEPEEIMAEQRQKLDSVTAKLCELCQIISDKKQIWLIPADTQVWWSEHQQIDMHRRRAEAERLKTAQAHQAALEKAHSCMSPAELRSLGLL